MAVNLSPIGGAGWQFFNNNGVPLSGGLIYTYVAGTSTPLVTYTSVSGLIANSNPIVLDSARRGPQRSFELPASARTYLLRHAPHPRH